MVILFKRVLKAILRLIFVFKLILADTDLTFLFNEILRTIRYSALTVIIKELGYRSLAIRDLKI